MTAASVSQQSTNQIAIEGFLPRKSENIREPLKLLLGTTQLNMLQRRAYWLVLRELKQQQTKEHKAIAVPDKDLSFTFHYSEIYSGHINQEARKTIEQIKVRDIEILSDNGDVTRVTIFPLAKYKANKGLFTFELHRMVVPLFLNLADGFSKFDLHQALELSSEYAQMLFTWLSKHRRFGKWQVSLDELRELIAAKHQAYDRYNNFKVRVLEVALSQINKNTDMQVSFKPIKSGRSITAIHFTIEKPADETGFQDYILNILSLSLADRLERAKEILVDPENYATLTDQQRHLILNNEVLLDKFLRADVYVEKGFATKNPTGYLLKSLGLVK